MPKLVILFRSYQPGVLVGGNRLCLLRPQLGPQLAGQHRRKQPAQIEGAIVEGAIVEDAKSFVSRTAGTGMPQNSEEVRSVRFQ